MWVSSCNSKEGFQKCLGIHKKKKCSWEWWRNNFWNILCENTLGSKVKIKNIFFFISWWCCLFRPALHTSPFCLSVLVTEHGYTTMSLIRTLCSQKKSLFGIERCYQSTGHVTRMSQPPCHTSPLSFCTCDITRLHCNVTDT